MLLLGALHIVFAYCVMPQHKAATWRHPETVLHAVQTYMHHTYGLCAKFDRFDKPFMTSRMATCKLIALASLTSTSGPSPGAKVSTSLCGRRSMWGRHRSYKRVSVSGYHPVL